MAGRSNIPFRGARDDATNFGIEIRRARRPSIVITAMFWSFTATRYLATKLNGLTSYFPPPPKAADDTAPRKILLVHSHPVTDSYSSALADAVVEGAKEGGHEIRRRSLYQEKFRPELTSKERSTYFDTAEGSARLSSDIKSHLKDLRWADSLILVYPTWWFNLPSMLKGYFDRTMVPGHDCAWDFPKSGDTAASNGLVPKLTNIKRVMGVTTLGAPRKIAVLAIDNGRNTISTAIRPNFDPDCTCHWHALYGMDDQTEAERAAFVQRVKKAVKEEF